MPKFSADKYGITQNRSKDPISVKCTMLDLEV
jgi:hypothetical protein